MVRVLTFSIYSTTIDPRFGYFSFFIFLIGEILKKRNFLKKDLDTKALLHIVKLKDETEKLNQKEKDQLHNLLSRMMGKKARSPRKMHSRVSVESGE